jgi:sialic acid synthase SpsE
MEKAIIIAEVGECFNGDLEIAKKLILVAKKAGCDIAKFQTLDFEGILENDPEKEWFEKIAFNPEKIKYIATYARKIDMPILFSPENKKTASWLLDIGFKDVKIPSSLIIDMGLIKFINKHFRRVFMSTGMASLSEIKKAVNNLDNVPELYILHCVSEYPTGPLLEKRGLKAMPDDDARLNMMKILMNLFPGHKIGYSDHTSGIIAPVLAVAAGAKVIEKHITLDRSMPIKNYKSGKKYLGTDHILSLEPQELREMVKQIRLTERILGTCRWERSKGEVILRDFMRKRFKG